MKAITANLLTDGSVVYLGVDGDWRKAINEAATFNDAEGESALKSAARRIRDVADIYLIEVNELGAPTGRGVLREEIRRVGPTVRPDLARPEAL